MTDIPYKTSTVKGQQIIATRAHTSVSRLWNQYVPNVTASLNLTGREVFSGITNILDNTARPTILFLTRNPNTNGTHAVLAYDHVGASTVLINDPNYPGAVRTGGVSLLGNLTYGSWGKIAIIGNGSFRTEGFDNIYDDAESGFDGSGRAQVVVESHTDGETVTDRTISLTGKVNSGLVLVDKLTVWLNGTTKFEAAIAADGAFGLAISLVEGDNKLTFETSGTDTSGNTTSQLNDQIAPYVVKLETPHSQILVTLTWNTNDTDIDLYTIDPSGDYSAYFNQITADGGELDYDNTSGFGPEHWTLYSTDTVRWGQEYNVRAHYYSDHSSVATDPTIPTRWNINVLLYEGTLRAQSFNFSGVLLFDSSSNDAFDDVGPDWADVCTIVPIESVSAALAAPRMENVEGETPRLIIPMPSESERRHLKAVARDN